MKTITGKLILVALSLVWALAATRPAQAQNPVNAQLNVSVSVNGVCLVNGGSLIFPNIVDPPGIPVGGEHQDTNFTVFCTNGIPYAVNLDNGLHSTPASRRMQDPGLNLLEYQLYTSDPVPSTIWGTGFAGGVSQAAVGTGGFDTWTVHGLIPSQAFPPPGGVPPGDVFTDTVVISVNF